MAMKRELKKHKPPISLGDFMLTPTMECEMNMTESFTGYVMTCFNIKRRGPPSTFSCTACIYVLLLVSFTAQN